MGQNCDFFAALKKNFVHEKSYLKTIIYPIRNAIS